jgi:hypothetical protein
MIPPAMAKNGITDFCVRIKEEIMVSGRDSKTGRNLILAGVLIAVVLLLFFLFPEQKKISPPLPRPAPLANPWKQTSVPYDAPCDEECVKKMKHLAEVKGVHAGKFNMYYQPDIDDEIAQWGDCLQSIMTCIETRGGEGPAVMVRPCVLASDCPDLCKKEFKEHAGLIQDFEGLMGALEKTFILDSALCMPQEERANK